MLSKKILSLGLTALLSASMLVGCSDDKKDKTESSNTKQEQKTFKEETITDNEYIKMTLIGKEKNEYGAIALKVLIENKTDKALGVYEENFQVNGVMNDPCWCCNVNAGAKAISFIEWYPNNELNSNVKTVDDLKNIKGDIYIADSDYNEIFRTQVSILCETESTKENKTVNTEQVQKETTVSISDEKQDQALNTPKDTNQNETKSTQKKSNENTTKEEPSNKHKCWLCKKNITNENFGGYSEDGTIICYRCLNKYGKDEPEEPKEEGYYMTCPNGHKVWTVNGDYDCQQCYDDWQEQQEADNTEEYEDGYIKDGTQLGENEWNYDDEEPIQEADDVE